MTPKKGGEGGLVRVGWVISVTEREKDPGWMKMGERGRMWFGIPGGVYVPHAGRAPAFPVILLCSWPPLPRSSVPACTTIVRCQDKKIS